MSKGKGAPELSRPGRSSSSRQKRTAVESCSANELAAAGTRVRAACKLYVTTLTTPIPSPPAAETLEMELPAAEPPDAEPSAAEMPEVKPSVAEPPAAETRAAETPDAEPTAVAETPEAEQSAEEPPAAETPATETPAAVEAPAARLPATETPALKTQARGCVQLPPAGLTL